MVKLTNHKSFMKAQSILKAKMILKKKTKNKDCILTLSTFIMLKNNLRTKAIYLSQNSPIPRGSRALSKRAEGRFYWIILVKSS